MVMTVGAGGSGAKNPLGSLERLHGGNGGDVAIKFFTPSSNTSVTITIGAGGAPVNTTGNGNDGANTTVVGTGINVVAAGGKAGIQQATATNQTDVFNDENAASSGADLIFKGGRTRSFNNGIFAHGSSVFGSNGTRADGSTNFVNTSAQYPGNPFVSGGNSGGLHFYNTPLGRLLEQARAGTTLSHADQRPFNNLAVLQSTMYRTNLLNIILPNVSQAIENYDPIAHRNLGSIGRIPTFVAGVTADNADGFAGVGAGGGGIHRQSGSSGAGGDGLVIIWSFVNG
jgi:hypothetical protein